MVGVKYGSHAVGKWIVRAKLSSVSAAQVPVQCADGPVEQRDHRPAE